MRDLLINGIRKKLFPLGDDVTVLPRRASPTKIGAPAISGWPIFSTHLPGINTAELFFHQRLRRSLPFVRRKRSQD